jgi:DNA-cytosine methyltransferase
VRNEPTILDLFSGIGGFSLGFESKGFRTVAFSEIDPEASLVLKHWWPDVPNLGDIRTITGDVLRSFGTIDVITGGVPCQPASALGQMRGAEDERWLWPETIRLVGEARPLFGVFENPPSLAVLNGGREFNGILSGLSALGYDLWWDVVPAAAVGAGHLRERLILVATNSDSGRWRTWRSRRPPGNCERQTEQALRLESSDAQGVGKRGTANETYTVTGNRNARSKSECEGSLGLATNVGSKTGPEITGGDCGIRSQRRESISHNGEGDSREIAVAVGNSKGLEGHARDGSRDRGRSEARRPIAPPNLRGRVSSERWWHEDVTGIPVLVHGISNRLAEASCRCTGNAIVPQVAQIYAQAIMKVLTSKP